LAKSIDTDTILIILSTFLFGIAFSIYDPIWPFLVKEAGVNPSFYGFIASGAQVFEFFVRWMSSAYIPPVMAYIAGSLFISTSTGILLYELNPSIILTSLSTIRMGRALHFLGRNQVVSIKFKKKGIAFSATRVVWQIGGIIGPIIGYILLTLFYRQLIFITGVFLGIMSALIAYPLIKTLRTRAKGKFIFWKGSLTKEARNITLLTVLNNFARQTFIPFHFIVAPYIFNATPEFIALAAIIERSTSILAGIPIGWLSDILGERRTIMTFSEAMMIIGILFYIFPSLGILGFLVSTFFLGMGMASYAPIAMALVSELSPERPEDTIGFLLASISLSRLPAPIITGGLIALAGYGYAFVFSAICLSTVGVGLMLDYIKVKEKQ